MAAGFQKTLNLLLRTPNRSASLVLQAGLHSRCRPISSGVVGVIARRSETASHLALLDKLRDFDDSQLTQLAAVRHLLQEALELAITGDDAQRCDNACHLILTLREYDLFPAIISAIETRDRPATVRGASTLVRLAKLLHDEIEMVGNDRPRRDPYFVRRQVVSHLSSALDRYQQHGNLEIAEAYLLLVPHDHAGLTSLLANPCHPAYDRVLESLGSSPSPGVMRLLAELIKDTKVPTAVLETIASRVDAKFVEYLLSNMRWPVPARVLKNMERLDQVDWLTDQRSLLVDLSGRAQRAAVSLALASSIRRGKVFSLLSLLLRSGQPLGREASCAALAEFPGGKADQLIEQAMEDREPKVQAAAVRQLRRREMPGMLPKLVGLLDSPVAELRQAAQSSLEEFNFASFSEMWDRLTPEQRSRTGAIVGKSDPSAVDQLKRDMAAPSPTQQARALDMIGALQLVKSLVEPVCRLLADPHTPVATRVAAAALLSECNLPDAGDVLERAASDSQHSVRDAANAAWQSWRIRFSELLVASELTPGESK